MTSLLLLLFLGLIGFSRIYLGVHSLNQVLLGWVYAIMVLILYIGLAKKPLHQFIKSQASLEKEKLD